MREDQLGQYQGDSLRFLLLNYSKDRMRRDKTYRAGVQDMLEERRNTKVAKEEAKDA